MVSSAAMIKFDKIRNFLIFSLGFAWVLHPYFSIGTSSTAFFIRVNIAGFGLLLVEVGSTI